ncbi:MAG: AAA family ATPase [Bifidobacteriaceae bacterium]|jgi:energy-coupling factor transporter ATP-binding protein EcfA2|nr:AAA family ATPase [Bifidobacteriaceae bacterium]
MLTENASKWQRELNEFLGVKSTFILEGNTKDLYPIAGKKGFEKIDGAIYDIFQDQYDFLFCDPLFGFYPAPNEHSTEVTILEINPGEADLSNGLSTNDYEPSGATADAKIHPDLAQWRKVAKQQRNNRTRQASKYDRNEPNDRFSVYAEIIRAAITTAPSNVPKKTGNKPMVCVVNNASRAILNPERLSEAENYQFQNLLYASMNAAGGQGGINTLILLVEKQNDLPPWFYLNNPNVRTIILPAPDRKMREAYINLTTEQIEADPELKTKFVDATERMLLTEIDEIVGMNEKNGGDFSKIFENLSVFKYGVKENKWETELQAKFAKHKDLGSILRRRVKGQEQAITKISQIIERAVTGLSGVQHSSKDSKPRGIAFLAGPTGTGKTEMVKTVTELLFEDENAMIRLDMSEFSEQHAAQRLFGAPPGYIGYDSGGELTNAIKANPFSVVLFDEIEKAHPSVMDKFLQILEDGRMTDGQGNTVYFSESIIFFTSNIGVVVKNLQNDQYELNPLAAPDKSYSQLSKEIKRQIALCFKPEFLNRLGRNIIVFDYISEEIAREILAKQIETVSKSLQKRSHITLTGLEFNPASPAFELLFQACKSQETKANGGRGIGNVVEEMFVNPLSDYIFHQDVKQSTIKVSTSDDSIRFQQG